MALVDIRDLLQHANAHGYAVGAFDLVGLEFLDGVLCAAERARAPVPVAILLDDATSLDTAVRAIRHGCNGVMMDVSHLPLGERISASPARWSRWPMPAACRWRASWGTYPAWKARTPNTIPAR